MGYNTFARKAFKETILGISYLPNIFAMFFVGLLLLSSFGLIPVASRWNIIWGLLATLLSTSIGILEYTLFNVLMSDYKEDRKNIIN